MSKPHFEQATSEKSLSLKKAISILRTFSRTRRELSIAEIVEILGMPRTVCYRLVATLEEEQFLERNSQTGHYRIGLEMFRLGSLGLRSASLRDAAIREMQAVAAETDDVVVLSVEHNLKALCGERVDGVYPIQQNAVTVGRSLPLYAGGGPFALLAHLPDDIIDAVLNGELIALTKKTLTDPQQIRERMIQIRLQGYAVGDEDLIDYLVAIGAPIFDASGRIVAALSVGGIKQRYPASRIRDVAAVAVEAANRISSNLGRRREIGEKRA